MRALNLALNKAESKIMDLESEIRGRKLKYAQIQEENASLKMIIEDLQKKIGKYEKIAEFLEEETEDPSKNIQKELISNFFDNYNLEPHGHRFSTEVYQFSKLLDNISPKCYDIIRKALVLPCQDSIDKFFSIQYDFYKSSIKDVNLLENLIIDYKKSYSITEPIPCILAVDAASLDRPNEYSDTFVFTSYLQPLNENYKCLPINIYSKSNGKANQDIVKLIYNIIDNLKKNGYFYYRRRNR